jgi:GTPase SAR1 family protein
MDFKDKVEEQLQGLEKKQICRFAWLCGVRALPFLSAGKRGFVYWPEDSRQKHLHSVFRALDIAYARTAAYAAYAAADAYAANARTAAYAAYAAADAAAAYATDTAADSADSAAAAATDAAAAADAAKIDRRSFEELLLSDIKAIRTNNLASLNIDISIYGETWQNFLEDLNSVGCSYWARIYKDLFQSGFVIAENELNRHLSVPLEIRDQGADAVGRYLERLGDDVECLNEARIIILGEKGAGKTSLARKLHNIYADIPKEEESTEGVITSIWNFPDKYGDKKINAHIWDFAGHSITHSAHRCFMSARCLYIYVYNGRIERDNDPAYWLEQIRIHGGDSPVLFLINEKDDHKADIAERALKKDYPSIAGYYSVDIGSENKTELEKFCQTVMEMVRDNPAWNNQVVSAEAYKIKSELRERFDKKKSPYITHDEFEEIAEKHGVSGERVVEILEDLHTLGICLWYNKEEMKDFNTLVLNPDWITNGIYRIINRGFNDKKYILSVTEGVKILKDEERYKYPREKVAYLFRLMRIYELAFYKDNNRIFIPGILPIDMPDELPTFDDVNERLTMSFVVVKALPPNIIARVIVQRSEFGEIFDERLLWRKGAVLKYQDGEATAHIVEEGLNVIVRVKGADKTAYIASLRETLKGIFESYKAIKPDLLYEVLIPEETKKSDFTFDVKERHEALMLPEKTIGVHTEKQMPYLDPITERLFSLLETALAYRVPNVTNIINVPINIEIQNTVIKLKDRLADLADDLREDDYVEDADYVEDVVEAVEKVRQIIDSTPSADVEEVLKKKKGLVSRIKGFLNDLIDENSELYKNTAKLRKGAKGVQSILGVYNDFAKLIPVLPQVPDTILNLGKPK